jgi:flagellar biosynthesis protein
MSRSKPPKKAVALTWDGQSAPYISATGEASVAEEILRIAREHEVPIYENPELVRLLAELELGQEIPELLYRTIAEIIAFVYLLKGKTPPDHADHPHGQAPDAPLLLRHSKTDSEQAPDAGLET